MSLHDLDSNNLRRIADSLEKIAKGLEPESEKPVTVDVGFETVDIRSGAEFRAELEKLAGKFGGILKRIKVTRAGNQ